MLPTAAPRFIESFAFDATGGVAAASRDLLATPARIAPRFFYDRLGSTLFEAITELDAYYPTRTEAAIFEAHGRAMADSVGPGRVLVDLGAGNGAKAARLFPLLEPKRYVAVDVSVDFLREALRRIQRENPRLEIVGLGLDFASTLELPDGLVDDAPPLFFYPGSSIGNFTPDDALAFLRRIHERAGAGAGASDEGGGILIGVDLVKDCAVLESAYDDELGVTSAFNLNALVNLNRSIGSDFDPRQWKHVAFFDAARSRIEMHLEARQSLVVSWPDASRAFSAGERIHTENSCKYTVDGFADLLVRAGFRSPRHWTDERGWFAVFHAAA